MASFTSANDTSAITTDTIWHIWTDTSGTSATCTSDDIWAIWTAATTSGSVTYEHAGYTPPPETEEQQEARLEREQRHRERMEAVRLEREEAQRKAQELLRENLNKKQREQFDETNWFFVVSQSGKQYRIRNGWAGNIDELNEEGMLVAEYCIHPTSRVPTEDSMLAQKLLLETAEERFLEIANKTTFNAPRPLAI